MAKFIEVTTTDNQKLQLNPDLVSACEAVTGSSRVEGHVKVYSGGFKFLVKEELPELLKKLGAEDLTK